MSTYEYPRFSLSDIITVLAEAQIATVTETELKNPTPDLVFDLYPRLLIYLDVINEEDKEQVDFEALEQLENPDAHVTSVQAINLSIKVKQMLEMVGCPEKFTTFRDLLRPEPSRTACFFSALLNYGLHKRSKMDLISEKVEELNFLDEQRREWEGKISQLNAEIAEFDDACEKDLPFVKELEANIEELSQKISGLNNEQASLLVTYKKMKDKRVNMDNEISKAEFELVQTVQENANLRSQIVQSPDKLQGALEEKKQVLGETKKAERLAMETFQKKAAILEVYEKAFKKMSKSSTQLQLINEQVANAKAIEKDFKALKAKLSEDWTVYKSLEAKVVERERVAQQLDESLKQLEKEKAVMLDGWTKQLNELKLEVESKRRHLEARQTDVESIVAKVDANTTKINEVKQSGEVKVKQLTAKYEEIMKQFHEYTVSFGEILPSL